MTVMRVRLKPPTTHKRIQISYALEAILEEANTASRGDTPDVEPGCRRKDTV